MKLQELIINISQLNHLSIHEQPEQEQFFNNIRQEQWNLSIKEQAETQIQADDSQSAFLITDSRTAADMALEQGIGFAVYLNEKSRSAAFPEALYCVDNLSLLSATQIERMYLRFHRLPWTILETERCVLREITMADVDVLYEIYADKEISKYTEDLFADREEELAYTKDYIEHQYRFYEYGMWVVIRKSDGRLIGRAGLSNREGFEEAELGYVIAADCQRQGYACEVCRAVLHYAWDELGMQTVNAFTMRENQASEALLKKLGFSYLEQVKLSDTLYDRYMSNIK